MKRLMIVLAAAVVLTGCGQKGTTMKLPSGGGPYEVIVVADDADWKGAVGDSVESVLRAPVPSINSYEPQFDVFRILPDRFVKGTRRNGNVIVVDIDTQYEAPKLSIVRDEFAQPQVVIHAVAPDGPSLARLVSANGDILRETFNSLEQRRWTQAALGSNEPRLQARVAEKLGVGATIPKGFVEDKATASVPDFLWAKFDYPEAFQTLAFYSYPSAGDATFTLDGMIAARDSFVANIAGELPDSHMITVREIAPPTIEPVTINGRAWVEMRGFWEVAGDTMGGPFVSYSTIDEATGCVVVIDGGVFSPSPQREKRNLLRQLESIVHSVRFPETVN